MARHFRDTRVVVDELIRRAARGDVSPWIGKKGDFDEVVVTALQLAIDRASELQGTNIKKWEWGKFHQVKFQHPLAAISPLHLLFNPNPQAVGGSAITVMAASWNLTTGEVNHGAGWRGVMDLADLSR
ncbi:penicillin acylase family protein, partial [Anaerobacillus sp. CMMVII]|uniref:penicillin acylase family protein n=1 Tax=Anaerobacillus sp. CMMVII TaxID=2755588 RepID=UPI0021B751C5